MRKISPTVIENPWLVSCLQRGESSGETCVITHSMKNEKYFSRQMSKPSHKSKDVNDEFK